MLPERPLPIAVRKGKKPTFELSDLYRYEETTKRFDCAFENIQQFLEREVQQRIPKQLADALQGMSRWQLVVPTTFDAAQILFLGRQVDDRRRIAIDEAQAIVHIHRGAEGGSWSNPRGKYGVSWLEIACIFPDSNGDSRILGVHYNNQVADPMRATTICASVADNEYKRKDTIMDQFIPVLRQIPSYKKDEVVYVAGMHELFTRAMIDALPRHHRRVLSVHPKPTLHLHTYGGPQDEIDFDQGISVEITKGSVGVGLLSPLGGTKPWVMRVPDRLEKITGVLELCDSR